MNNIKENPYQAVSIPKELHKEIKEFMENNKLNYYHTIASFVKDTLQEKIKPKPMEMPGKNIEYWYGYIDGFAKGIKFAFSLLKEDADEKPKTLFKRLNE